ncbi:MAG TPA: hypothetical protein VGN13_12385 [Solirubrobacteraceae bacterium]|jgi:hypothetical protein
MALVNPPFVIQSGSHGAELFRDAISTLIGSTGGTVTTSDYSVSEHVAANMSVNVGVGQAWVPGTSTTSQGLYYIRNAATVNLAITASNETNPRIDKVVLRIKDEAYAGTGNEAVLEVVKGTAESGATLANHKGAGATPVSSLLLAYVLVPAKATSIVAADIENVQPAAAGNLPPPANEYGALTTRGVETAYEASLTRPATVLLNIKSKLAWAVQVQVIAVTGSAFVTIASPEAGAPSTGTATTVVTFPLPARSRWQVKPISGTTELIQSSYLLA